MTLIIGLGNPGQQYENTRHNAGFMVLDLLAGGLEWGQKYDSQFLKAGETILAKPQQFMNLSGAAVAQIRKFYPEAELIVVHDELDLPFGTMKVQRNVSSAGHNGVQSVMDELGTKDFIRIRLGIDNPETRQGLPGDAYVLQKFTDQETERMREVIARARDAIQLIQAEGLEAAQSKFNG